MTKHTASPTDTGETDSTPTLAPDDRPAVGLIKGVICGDCRNITVGNTDEGIDECSNCGKEFDRDD